MKVIKRNGRSQEFNTDKIFKVVSSANESVPEEERITTEQINKLIKGLVRNFKGWNELTTEDIDDIVVDILVNKFKAASVVKAYIEKREAKKNSKKFNDIEEKVLAIIEGDSDLRGDNANKHIDQNCSISDYIAGITTKSIVNKIMPKRVADMHNRGLGHMHDTDYSPIRPMHNCFHEETRFVTEYGNIRFKDCIDGDKVHVKDKDGNIRLATVHRYGKQHLQQVTLISNRRNTQQDRTILCTSNHRWILKDGSVTTDLKVGDELYLLQNSTTPVINNEDDAKMWCLGFILGDGCDKGAHTIVRLCGHKTEYAWIFEKAGFRMKGGSHMVPYTKFFSKQDFINAKGWRYLTPAQKALVFQGYYAADGRTNKYNISTADERLEAFIEECSGIAGYHIYKTQELNYSTNYKENAHAKQYHFRVEDKDTYGYKVQSITDYHRAENYVWCVEEPVTHTFTLEGGIVTGNCDLLNVGDMLENTFQMGNTKIVVNDETPFETICNLIAQINLIVSGCQYGGQTISWIHAVPYIDKSRKLIEKAIRADWEADGVEFDEKKFRERVEKRVRAEVAKGVKTYQYQVLCHSSSNGQTPFVSNNLCLREAETRQELEDFAMLIEEILKRRTKGVQDDTGQYISPLFPKLLYWTCDGLNVKEDDEFYYLMKYVAECESLRMQPDIVSEKQTRLVKNGQIIPSMGCRSMLSPIWEEHTYPVDKEFYWVEGVGTYPYGTFVDKRSFKDFENREYKTGYEEGEVSINFRGNTGWLLKKTETEVVIKEPVVYGRFNCGVFSLNLPHIGLSAAYSEYAVENDESVKFEGVDMTPADIFKMVKTYQKEADSTNNIYYCLDLNTINETDIIDHFEVKKENDEIKNVRIIYKLSEEEKIQRFYEILDERLDVVHEALLLRYKYVRRIKGKNSPILWQYGGLSRIGADETVGDLIDRYPTRPSISIGYAGLYETCQALIGESNITPKGQRLSQSILQHLNDKAAEWKAAEGLGYAIYGTPEESLTYKFALANRRDFGLIPKITDKDYVVNSYHIDPREHVDAFTKLKIEGSYLALSAGGAVSYVETADLIKNPEAIITLVQYIHEHIMYAEINRKIGVCKCCGYVGDIPLLKENGEFIFRCPNCGNTDDNLMDVTARICGYLGKVNAGNTNKGRLDDIYNRVLHTDCEDEVNIDMMDKTTEVPCCYETE